MENSKSDDRVDRFRTPRVSDAAVTVTGDLIDDFVLTSGVPVSEFGHSTAGCPVTASPGLRTGPAAIMSVASIISQESPPRPRMSPRSELRADILAIARYAKAGLFSAGMLAAMVRNVSEREQSLKEQGLIDDSPLSPGEERDLTPLSRPVDDDDDEYDYYDDNDDDYSDDDYDNYDDFDDDDNDYVDDNVDDNDNDNENPIPKRLHPIITCVLCEGEHQAMYCPRPNDKPTSVNSLGAQSRNVSTCSVLKTAAVPRAVICPTSRPEATTAAAADAPPIAATKQRRRRRVRGRGGRKKRAAINRLLREALEMSAAPGASVQSDGGPRPTSRLEATDADAPSEQPRTQRDGLKERVAITLAEQEAPEAPATPDASMQSETRPRLTAAAAVLRAEVRPAFRPEDPDALPAAVAEQPRTHRATRRRKHVVNNVAAQEGHEAPSMPGASVQGATATSKHPLPDIPPSLLELIRRKRTLRRRWQQTRCPRMMADLRVLANQIKSELNTFRAGQHIASPEQLRFRSEHSTTQLSNSHGRPQREGGGRDTTTYLLDMGPSTLPRR